MKLRELQDDYIELGHEQDRFGHKAYENYCMLTITEFRKLA